MPSARAKSFENCPLCHNTGAVKQTKTTGFWHSIKASRCSVCSALFVSGGQHRYRLQSCDPARLGKARGKSQPQSGCSDCPPVSECYLGRSLSESDWEHVGRGEPLEGEREFTEKKARMEVGDLPQLPTEESPVALGPGEKLHHIATVYTCEQPLPGDARDEGKLVVTSHRLVLLHEGTALEIRIENVQRLERAFPGFLVYVKGSNQPFCFFPRRGDPVMYAVEGALRRARGEK